MCIFLLLNHSCKLLDDLKMAGKWQTYVFSMNKWRLYTKFLSPIRAGDTISIS